MPRTKKAERVAPKLRGFAVIAKENPKRMKAIASRGGVAAHQSGTAHEFNKIEASYAGRLGGAIRRGDFDAAEKIQAEYEAAKANGFKKVTKTVTAKKGGAGKKTSQNKPAAPAPKSSKKATPAKKAGKKK